MFTEQFESPSSEFEHKQQELPNPPSSGALSAEEEKKSDQEVAANFYYWRDVYPELQVLYDNIKTVQEEAEQIPKWVPWPEDHFSLNSSDANTRDWTVFPLLYTFPAFDESRRTWVPSTCSHCPKTVALLKTIPNVKTALFSRLGPNTKLSSHTGWADLSNYVLRSHLCLDIPTEDRCCGLLVNGDVQYHRQNQIIVFDDSKPHRAFNHSDCFSRTVLIVDLTRPAHIPLGTATGHHTEELDGFVSMFK